MDGTARVTSAASSASAAVDAPKLVDRSAPSRPGTEVIDVAVAVHVEQVRTFRTLHKRRMPTHRPKRAHRRIHTSGNQRLGASLQFAGAVQSQSHLLSVAAMRLRGQAPRVKPRRDSLSQIAALPIKPLSNQIAAFKKRGSEHLGSLDAAPALATWTLARLTSRRVHLDPSRASHPARGHGAAAYHSPRHPSPQSFRSG